MYSTAVFHLDFTTSLLGGAYKTWIEELDERFAGLIKHLVIEGVFEVRKSGYVASVTDRYTEGVSLGLSPGWASPNEDLYRRGADSVCVMEDIKGDWSIRWQNDELKEPNISCMLQVVTSAIIYPNQRDGAETFGLGKSGIERAVAMYSLCWAWRSCCVGCSGFSDGFGRTTIWKYSSSVKQKQRCYPPFQVVNYPQNIDTFHTHLEKGRAVVWETVLFRRRLISCWQ